MILIVCTLLTFLLKSTIQQSQVCEYGEYQHKQNKETICVQCPSTCPKCQEYEFETQLFEGCSRKTPSKLQCLVCEQGVKNCQDQGNITCFENYQFYQNENNTNQAVCVLSPQNRCQINQFYNENKGQCQSCPQRCKTCQENSQICIECGQNYVKQGWKCIPKHSIYFQISLKVEKDTVQSMKKNFTRAIGNIRNRFGDFLKSGYQNKKYSKYLTIRSVTLKANSKQIKLNGFIDPLSKQDQSSQNTTAERIFQKKQKQTKQLAQSFTDQFCNRTFIGEFHMNNLTVTSYNFFPIYSEKSDGFICLDKPLVACESFCQKPTFNELKVILIVCGVLLLLILILCLLFAWENRKRDFYESQTEKMIVDDSVLEQEDLKVKSLKEVIDNMMKQIDTNNDIDSERPMFQVKSK